MAEEKKTNLKDRLKKTQVGAQAPVVAPPSAGGAAAPAAAPVAGPSGAGTSVPAPAIPGIAGPAIPGLAPPPGVGGIPGIPGLGGDIAPPAFVQQQQAAAEAARRAAAAAADPFSAAAHAPVGPQEVRLVIDEKPVDDKEVGRNRAGILIAVGVTGALALGAGYALGNLMESKNQERQTVQALTGVRSSVTSLGDVIGQARQRIDRAMERGNIPARAGGEEGGDAPAAQHPPDVDEELITWFQGQPPEPPFSPDVYAGRVGRLRANVVSKLAVVTLQLGELWRQLQAHVRQTNVANVRASIQAMNPQSPANQELSRLAVVFSRTQAGMPFAQLVSPTGPPNPQGAIPVGGPGIQGPATRTIWTGQAPLAVDQLANTALPLGPQGLPAQYRQTAVQPWQQYATRVRDMKGVVDQLAQTHQQLVDALSGGGSRR